MAELRHGEAQRLLAFVGDANTVDGPEPFTTELLDGFAEAMQSDFATYFEYDARMPTAHPRLTITCSRQRQYAPVPWPSYRDTPEWVRPLGDVVFWSDDCDRATRLRFERAPWVKAREVVDSAWTLLPAEGSDRGAVALFRQGRDFTEGDRRAFGTLGPHLTALIRNARARRRLSDLTAVAEAAADESSRGYVLLRGGLEVEHASPAARRIVGSWFDDPVSRLPALVEEWLRSGARGEPMVVERAGARLVLEAPTARALLVTEERTIPSTLTAREREVLRCLAAGKSTGEIAQELWVTPATVSKHLHHIYRKLGVTSRTRALAVVGTRL